MGSRTGHVGTLKERVKDPASILPGIWMRDMAEWREPFRLGKSMLSNWQGRAADKPQAEQAGQNTGVVRVGMDRVRDRWVATREKVR